MALTVEQVCAQCEISRQGRWPRWPAPCWPTVALQPCAGPGGASARPLLQGGLSPQGFTEPVKGKALPAALASPNPLRPHIAAHQAAAHPGQARRDRAWPPVRSRRPWGTPEPTGWEQPREE